MVSTCTVPGCKDHRRKRHAGISYYRFPVKDAERCKLWLRAIKNAKYAENTPVASLRNLRVCSLHFRIEDFERHLVPSITGEEGGKRLRNTAVPTLNLEIRDDEQPGTSAQPSLATRSETVPHAIAAVSTATAALTTGVSAVTVGSKDDEEPLPSSARPPPTKRPHKEAPHTVTAAATAYVGMKERARIAILEHNENIVKREQATTRAVSVEAAMTGVASSRDEMGGTLHLQCPLCGSFSKSHAHLLIHTANAHPDLLDETAVGRLGNVIIYQSIAQLFHCSRCFFTCKEFPKLYDHLISRHCTNRSQEGEADAGGEAKTGEGGEEEKEASLKRKRSSDREEEEEEGHNEDNSDLPPLPSNKTAEESGVLLFDGSGYRCLICGWKHKLKALGINHVVKRHDIPKTYATWALKQDASTLKPTHTGGGEEEEEKPNLLTQELLREEMEATAKVVRYINGRFVCLTCGWKNKLKGFAISHVARCHKVERPYSCSECDRTFFLPSQLQQHQSSKHRPGRYSCPFCFFRSDFLGGFRRHCSRCNARGEDEEEEAEGYGEGDEGEESDGDHGQESNKCR
ncbi:zinc finger protein 90 homolog isoform X1 [Lampris incognitus]|uniref:zinc finger protein 90 homolog isoform X1 n=1 Tax=Lampris incognitus TaxID=2546036 RepID=UPI0024B4826C|nr:zinc finger protein 90 homolog isoform X1 [Lampris incognitus]